MAVPRSGRSVFARSSDTHSVAQGACGSAPELIEAEPPAVSVGGKAVPRIVMNLMGSEDWTVAMALPA